VMAATHVLEMPGDGLGAVCWEHFAGKWGG
jgi:hypothetical protein